MYAVNFAGVGGTQHGCWATLRFMQRATADISPGDVTFPTGSMLELYRRDPVAFIKETVRLDAPVTSATCVFKEARDIAFDVSCCGGTPVSHHVADGTLHQYVLSVANRDPAKFEAPNTFNPSRANLDEMLGWNGTIAGGAAQYPRFCPGQKLAIVVIQTICSLLQELGDTAA